MSHFYSFFFLFFNPTTKDALLVFTFRVAGFKIHKGQEDVTDAACCLC